MGARVVTSTLLLFLVLVGQAWGGIEAEMNKMFGSMSNVTSPTGFMDQSRGVLSGGHVVVKNKIVSAELLGFDPPSIDAGCGGVDFYGGSFSFISADEFTQLIRSIGSNAASYAFKLGLQSMCPSCASTLEDLRKTIQQVNELASNSCNIAKGLVDAVGVKSPIQIGGAMEKSVFAGSVIGEGGLSGAFEGFLNTNKPKSNAKQGGAATQKNMGNIAWHVIAKPAGNTKKMMSWFEHGDDNLAQFIMSLTGTIVITPPANDQAEASVVPYYPTVTLSQIMGSANQAKTQIDLYQCTDGTDECLQVDSHPVDFKTMTERVREVMLGSTDGSSAGIVTKFVTNSGTLTQSEKDFLEVAPLHGKRLRDLSISSPTAATIYAKKAADRIALELTSRLVFDVMAAIQLAAAQNPHPVAATFSADLSVVRDSIEAEEKRISEQFKTDGSIDMLFDSLQKSTPRINWGDMQEKLKKRAAGTGG